MCFCFGHMGGVNEAPALINVRELEQSFNRPLATILEARFYFLDLLGDVNVERCIVGKLLMEQGELSQFRL